MLEQSQLGKSILRLAWELHVPLAQLDCHQVQEREGLMRCWAAFLSLLPWGSASWIQQKPGQEVQCTARRCDAPDQLSLPPS